MFDRVLNVPLKNTFIADRALICVTLFFSRLNRYLLKAMDNLAL